MTEIAPLAIIAAATALWSQIQGIFARIRALLICRTTLQGDVAEAVIDYLQTHAHIVNWGDRFIRGSHSWVRPLDRVSLVAYETAPTQPRIAFLNRLPVLFSALQNQHDSNLPYAGLVTITALRGTLNVNELTRAAIDFAGARKTQGKRYFIRQIRGQQNRFRNGGSGNQVDPAPTGRSSSPGEELRPTLKFLHWQSDDIGAPRPEKPFDAYAVNDITAGAVEDFRRWLRLKKWYQERSIPWRRGHLYYGQPGTGKTALARALAQEADMPVFAFDLSTLSNHEFSNEWLNMQDHTPCMAIIEDVDGVFHGRENVLGEQGGGLTFDCLLNALGGIQTANGVFIVITTNKPEHLDEALGQPIEGTDTTTRPGRLDRAYLIPPPEASQRRHIITRICGGCSELDLAQTTGMSAAQVTEWSISRALNNTWKD